MYFCAAHCDFGTAVLHCFDFRLCSTAVSTSLYRNHESKFKFKFVLTIKFHNDNVSFSITVLKFAL